MLAQDSADIGRFGGDLEDAQFTPALRLTINPKFLS
jgi:hypothetical protein